MGFSEIIAKLISDFEQQKESIEKEWDSKIIEKKREIDKKFEQLFEIKSKEIERQIEDSHHSRLLNSKLEQKNSILKKKRELINNVFYKAYQEILKLDDDKYISILIELIEKYSSKKDEVIFISEKEYSKLKDVLVKKLKDKGYSFKAIKGSEKIEKGFILLDEERKIETNLSFESIMKRKKEVLENHIGKIIHVI